MLPLLTLPAGLEPPPALAAEYATTAAKMSSGGKKSSKPYWKKEPYLQVGGGGQVFGSNGNTFNAWIVHGEAGYEYEYVDKGNWPRWGGSTRIGGEYIVQADNAEGMDLRVGTFFGPRWKNAGLQIGPDVFYNTWTYGQNKLPEAFGVEVPVTLNASLGQIALFAGGSGAITNNAQRARDWDLPLHEAAAFAGIGGTIEGFDIEASYEYRLTAAGEQQTIHLNARVDAETFWQLLGESEDDSGGGGKKKTDSGGDEEEEVGGAEKK